MLNNQAVEKVVKTFSGTLDVHSIFYTIQGEGPFAGTPAVFVRLAGCNLQCPWCDTEYTGKREPQTPREILARVAALQPTRNSLVVLTGGEPFRQQVGKLLDVLSLYYYVQVETNGTVAPPKLEEAQYHRVPTRPREGVYIVVSPKTGKVHPDVEARACAYKYVLEAGDALDDGLPRTALGHVANPHLARPPRGWDLPVYLQPADHQNPRLNDANTEAVVQSAMKHGYTVQVQIHKILGLE